MEISYGDFVIRPSQASMGFDLLVKKVSTNKETGVEKEGEHCLGYDMRMPRVMQAIIHHEMKQGGEVIQLEEFLERYNEETNALIEAFKDFSHD